MKPGLDRAARFGSAMGLVSPLVSALLVVTMATLHPNYSHLTNFISDLGALDAPDPLVQRLNLQSERIRRRPHLAPAHPGPDDGGHLGLRSRDR